MTSGPDISVDARSEPVIDTSKEAAGLAQLVVRRVRLAAACRALFLHQLWSDDERDSAARPIDRLALQADNPEAETSFRTSDQQAAAFWRAQQETDALIGCLDDERYQRLVDVFGLDRQARALLHLTLAIAFDPGLGPLLRHISPAEHIDYPTDELASRMFFESSFGSWQEDAALARWQICHRVPMGGNLPDRIELEPAVRRYLSGGEPIAACLLDCMQLIRPREPLDSWPVEETASELQRILQESPEASLQLEISGNAGSGRKTFSAAVASELGLGLFAVDLDRADKYPVNDVLVAAHRSAFLSSSAIFFKGHRATVPVLPVDLTQFPVIFIGQNGTQNVSMAGAEPNGQGASVRVSLPEPTVDERLKLWRRLYPPCATWKQEDLIHLAERHKANPGIIARIAQLAPRDASAASAHIRALDHDRFGHLATRVTCPFGFDDLVLPLRLETHLKALVHEARSRERFWEKPQINRLFSQGRGLVALFTGPPGTGKTMAAQVIAAELQLDLYRIDVSALISKYIGETMENIQRVLEAARAVDVVLLFDEADGLFARRTELGNSNDRHANTDTGHLLQAIESFSGIALLASNRKRNMDEAFTRRLRYIVEFPIPDETARLRIWHNTLGEMFDQRTLLRLSSAVDLLAHRIDLTGAHIKQSLLTAAFSADAQGRPLELEHLLIGIDSELMKDGRALNARDRLELEAMQ